MNSRRRWGILGRGWAYSWRQGGTALGLGLLLATPWGATGQAERPERPHVLWILSEDNSKHYLRLYDESVAPTPAIEGMAREGLVFEHAFSNSPVCSVARTTLMTSCYAPRIGAQFHRRLATPPMPAGLSMFPAQLRAAGYHTSNRVKTDYNVEPGEGVWDASSRKATWRDRTAGQPFFHMRSLGVSHESSLHFGTETMEREQTVSDPGEVALAPYHPDTPTFRYTHARYLDRMRDVDAEVDALLGALREEGLLEDTFVFYFGDHGGVLPRSKGYAYESGLHVPLVVRIPERWRHLLEEGWDRGTRVKGFVRFVDFGPTVLRLAGIEVPEEVDGRPFLGPGVAAKEVTGRDEAVGYADRFDEKADFVRTLRRGSYKYQRSYWRQTFDGLENAYRYRMLAYREWRRMYEEGALTAVQEAFFLPRAPEALYDLRSDPHETVNLAGDPAYAEVLLEMRERLGAVLDEWPDLSFYPESYLVEEAMEDPVAFGRSHEEEIRRLRRLADGQLAPQFSEIEDEVMAAVRSENRWERYWGFLVATAHGPAAGAVAGPAREAALTDPEVEVRARAAEFLGVTMLGDPLPGLLGALKEADSVAEQTSILNTAVLLRDGRPGYPVKIEEALGSPSHRYIEDRLQYLSGEKELPVR